MRRQADCFEVCRDLADRGLDAVCLACLVSLRSRLRDMPHELGLVWLFGAQLLASRVEESSVGGEQRFTYDAGGASNDHEASADGLCDLLDEVELCTERPRGLAGKLASLLWGLAEALCRRGRPQAATVWLHRALPFMAGDGRTAAGWRALAACHFAAGENARARRCAETALAHDPVDTHAAAYVLLDAVMRGEADVARGLLARSASSELVFSVAQLAYVAQMISNVPATDLHLDTLEVLSKCIEADEEAAAELGLTPQRVFRALLESSEACQQPTTRLATYLDAVARLKKLPDGESAWFFKFAWNRAVSAAEARNWADSVTFFESACVLLEHSGIAPIVDESWVHSAIAQALLQHARCADSALRKGLRVQALCRVERARSALRTRGRWVMDDVVGAAVDQNLAQHAFEALCFLQSPSINNLADELISTGAPDLCGAALLARVAVEAGDADRAARCLRAYLRLLDRTELGGGIKAAVARRELASLRHGRLDGEEGEELRRACEEAIGLLRSLGPSLKGGLPSCLPMQEALWLAAETWNHGADISAGKGELEHATHCMNLGLELLQLLSFVEPCNSHIRELRARLENSLCTE